MPKSLGGLDIEDNLVTLTYSEHCFAHYLLALIYPTETNLSIACLIMISNKTTLQDINFTDFKSFETIRRKYHDRFVKMNKLGGHLFEKRIKSGRYKTYTLHIKDIGIYKGTRIQLKQIMINLKIKEFQRSNYDFYRKKLTNIQQFINHLDRFTDSNNQIFIEILKP